MSRKHDHPCAIAEALNILGDRWTLLIIREAFYGATRFGEFLTNTGISRNLLTERLSQLVEADILERTPFADRGTSHAYALTVKGRALDTVVMALTEWGNSYLYGDGEEPVLARDEASGEIIRRIEPVTSDGQIIARQNIVIEAGPGGDGRTLSRISKAKSHPFAE